MSNPFNPFGSINDDDDSSDENIVFENNGQPLEPNPTPVIEQKSNIEPFKQDRKYNIIDQYWFINPKFFVKEKLEQGEAQLVTIGYNADFNNMRITLLETNGDTFTETAIHKYNAKQLVSVNVFTETIEQLKFNMSQSQNAIVHNFERIFSQSMGTQDWKPAKAVFELDVKKGLIKLIVNDNLHYTFIGWQLNGLLSVFKFMTNGQAWLSSLTAK